MNTQLSFFLLPISPMMKTLQLKGCLALLVILFFCQTALAQAPSAAQIEQFKRMSPAEQKALAQAMGIDLNDFSGLLGKDASNKEVLKKEEISGNRQRPATNPRMMAPNQIPQAFDQFGNPIMLPPFSEDELAELLEEDDDTLKPFGYSIFTLDAEAFAPATDIPVPADYVLGPGDSLVIQLYGKESASHTLTISRDGSVQFPKIGPVNLAGLNYTQATNKISDIVNEQMIGIKSSVTLGALRTIRVFVLGEVSIPGSYVVGSLSTMTNALFASGGIDDIGSLRNIQLKRAGKIVTTLDLYDLLLNGDTRSDARLLPGDVIFVPPAGRTASVRGAVKRPAIYELKKERTAADLLQLAGGLKATAYLPSAKIERIAPSGEKTLVEVDLTEGNAKKYIIKDSDTLDIGSTLDDVTDKVEIMGHVKRETSHAWKRGLRFSDLIQGPNAFLSLPDLNLGLIEREVPGSRQVRVLSFSPEEAFAKPMSDADPLLQPRDRIRLFGFEKSRTSLIKELLGRLKLQASYKQRQATVRIEGSVRFPGEYPLTENMSAKTLVELAGGYTESALGRDAEITRYDMSKNRERVVLHIKVDLSSSDPVIMAGDTLRVQQIPLWSEKETVTLKGEFIHPGVYAILPGESLVDVIERAGGLTAQAYPLGTIFSRAELRELEKERLEALRAEVQSDIAALSLESSSTRDDIDTSEAQQILQNIESTKTLGRMVINLPKILAEPKALDFQLIEGDVIEVPRYKPSITVVGEVQYPTSHFFDDSLSVKQYLERSGGLKRNADKKRVYVVKANGMVFRPKGTGWFGSRSTKLSPGDTIIVPIDTKRVDKLTLWTSVTSIMSSMGVAIAAISSL